MAFMNALNDQMQPQGQMMQRPRPQMQPQQMPPWMQRPSQMNPAQQMPQPQMPPPRFMPMGGGGIGPDPQMIQRLMQMRGQQRGQY